MITVILEDDTRALVLELHESDILYLSRLDKAERAYVLVKFRNIGTNGSEYLARARIVDLNKSFPHRDTEPCPR